VKLDEIVAHKRVETARLKESQSELAVEKRARAAAVPRGFALSPAQGAGIAVIAEIKRASPSRGVMVGPEFDAVAVARAYESGGASAISVLTDARYFRGDAATLESVRTSVVGADALLLIVRVLAPAELRDLLGLTEDLGMAALVEVHNESELDRALAAGAGIIGINNRDLDTFTVDLATTERLAPLVPADRVVVGESGISSRADVERVREAGARAVLVGESLVTSGDIAGKVRELCCGSS